MSKLNILIVEDDPGNAMTVESLVHELGYQSLGVVDNSEEALAKISTEEPDMIIMDINIKGKQSGIEVAEQIKDKKIPIIFVTGYDSSELYQKAKATLPVAYLIKPFNSLTLQSSIEFAINVMADPYSFLKEGDDSYVIKDAFFIKKNSLLEKVQFGDIKHINSEGNYSIIHTRDKKFAVKLSLSKMNHMLPKEAFLRTHQSFIIPVADIQRIDMQANVIHTAEKNFPIGRSYKDQVYKRLNRI